MERDRYGYPLATVSPEAAAAYRTGVDLLLSGYPGADAYLAESLRHDPGFALAHAALARHCQIYGRTAEARAAIERARGAGSSRRERQHIDILGLSIEGQPARALAALLEHADAYPRDALPLSLALGAFGLYAFSGRAEHDELRLELCRRLAPHYGEDWWMLTHLGWSHTEAGRLADGARITERALELKRDNAHAAHAYAHFFAEARLPEDGLRFVEGWLPGYGAAGTLYAHLHWHCALWHLERNESEAAAAILSGVLHPAVSLAPPINVVSDCASLLWRLSAFGSAAPRGARAQRVWQPPLSRYAAAFHRVASRDGRRARRRRTRHARRVAGGSSAAGRMRGVCSVRGEALCRGRRAPRTGEAGLRTAGRQRRAAPRARRNARSRARARGARRLEDLRLELDFFGVVLVHRLHRLAVGSDQAEGHLLLACKRVERPQP